MQKTTHFAVTQDKPTKNVPLLIKIHLFFGLSLPSIRELVSDFTWDASREIESQQKHHGFAWVHVEFRLEHSKAPDTGKEEICLYKTFPDISGWKWSFCLPTAISVASIIWLIPSISSLSPALPWQHWHSSLYQLLLFPRNPVIFLPPSLHRNCPPSDPNDLLISKNLQIFF